MTFWEFLRSQSDVPLSRVITFAAISGLANAALLAIINSSAHSATHGGWNTWLFLLFLIAISLFVVTQRYILRVSSIEVEKIIARLRVTLSDRIRQADLHSIEELGRARLYASVNTDTLTLSQATAPVIMSFQGAVLVGFSLVYILLLSPAAFRLTVLLVAIGVSIHFRNRRDLVAELERSTAAENEFFESLTHLLDGFKEIKLNQARSNDLYHHLQEIAYTVARRKTRTAMRYADYYIFTQVIFYSLLATMVFVLPAVSNAYSEQITQLTASILFIIGPLTMVVSLIPVLRGANHAVANIHRVEAELDEAGALARQRERGDGTPPTSFEAIDVRHVAFSYLDVEHHPLFTLGPIDLTIRRGETLLIVGGNGSGKSTFLKLLAGLYYPMAGAIKLDGVDVRTTGYQSYRELFSAVFSDYHLFDRLYGMQDVEDDRVNDLLRLMQLDHKTTWHEGRFENQELSTGQKKRLALIIGMLEDKPIYIFDEWAADQDPAFRKFFYESLLPEMKQRGKTIIAATHDDRYFHIGDRVIKMELGLIVPNGGGNGTANGVDPTRS